MRLLLPLVSLVSLGLWYVLAVVRQPAPGAVHLLIVVGVFALIGWVVAQDRARGD